MILSEWGGLLYIAFAVVVFFVAAWLSRSEYTEVFLLGRKCKEENETRIRMCAKEMMWLYKQSGSHKSYKEWLSDIAESAKKEWGLAKGAKAK